MFPWAASGRALGMGREEGLTKVLYEKGTKRILGAGIVGVNAGELIAETVLALEMGADAEDIGLTIHPHPTLSETVFFSAEIAEGTITDMMPPSASGALSRAARGGTPKTPGAPGPRETTATKKTKNPPATGTHVPTTPGR